LVKGNKPVFFMSHALRDDLPVFINATNLVTRIQGTIKP
jgi:hypothetical protein